MLRINKARNELQMLPVEVMWQGIGKERWRNKPFVGLLLWPTSEPYADGRPGRPSYTRTLDSAEEPRFEDNRYGPAPHRDAAL